MGLFDEIEIDGTLIGREPGSLVFQTKAFHCAMEYYRISAAGRLEIQEYGIEDKGDITAPAGSIERIMGCMTRVPTGTWSDLNWHGFVRFRDLDSEFIAKFTDGQLVKVEPL